jgi:phthalate 4,5-dioxygenase oxygenase subunit
MLSQEDNDLLTRVEGDAPMGQLLRRFWMPALLEDELAEPDGEPVKLRLLGEDLVAFKDSEGRIGILDAYCPHRRAHLFFGRNEDCGLRCVYHGWKFDVTGQCVDMPSESAETEFKHKVKTTTYPTAVRGGVIWIYMGPTKELPPLPDFEWSYLPPGQRTATKRLQQCNWAQAVEGGIDSSHVSFLHSNIKGTGTVNFGRKMVSYMTEDRHPVFHVAEQPHGLLIGARRNAGDENYYWRFTQAPLPFYNMIPPPMNGETSRGLPYAGHAWVPIDDHNTWTWSFSASPSEVYADDLHAFQGGKEGMWGPVDDDYRPKLNRENVYGLDRAKQREETFTGIDGIPNQDAAVQESMGPITDRTKEHLGSSDMAVIAWRKLILRLCKELQAGDEPAAALDNAAFNIRSASIVLPREADWLTDALALTAGLTEEERAGLGRDAAE